MFSAYFFTAKLGLQLVAISGFATLVWPPTGIALASLLIYGYSLTPAIFLAAFLINFQAGATFWVAIGIAIGNSLESLVGVFLLKRVVHFRKSLESLKDVFGLIFFVAIFSTTISATIGVLTLFFSGIVDFSSFQQTWIAWWIGDMLGALVIAPLILLWSIRPKHHYGVVQIIEGLIVHLVLIFFCLVIFYNFLNLNPEQLPIGYIIFLPLIWIALRFGQRESVTATFIVSLIAISAVSSGYSMYADNPLSVKLILAQGFVGVIAVTFMSFSAVIAERKKLERRKDEFISIAAHELKTPITTIAAYVQLFERFFKKTEDKKMWGYTVRINQQVDRLIKLVNDLLDVTKINSNKLAMNFELFPVRDLVQEVINDMQLISHHHIILKGETNKHIYADRYRISQVLINLITNAVKFSPKAKKVIVQLASDNKYMVISVKDYGIGINKKHQDKIFGRFYQMEKKDNRNIAGLGLGLFISSEIIKSHRGQIWVTSKEKKGSTFSIKLPINLSK